MRTVRIILANIAVATVGVFASMAPAGAHQESTVHSDEPATRQEAAKTRVQGRLDDAKRKVCETRKTNVGNTMQKAAAAGQRHLTAFKNIYNRVTEFYTNKKLTIAAYESLATTAQAKYDAAAAAIKAAKDATGFDCNGDNPVGTADQYKGKIKVMHDALKEYRSAVHAMLVAVKTAAASEGAQ